MTFDDIWKSIERDRAHDSAAGIIRRRILPNACCALFLGIEKPSNRRVLLLRIAAANVPDATLLPQARGFEVRFVTLPDDPQGDSSVLLSQSNDTFRDIFTILTTDIAEHIAPTTDQKTAVEQFLVRLQRWQQFLERSGPEGLGDEAQRGLFGELWFICNYLVPVLGVQAVTAWTGPFLTAQDFQLPRSAIEVKTTTAKEHQKLAITGEKQLESSPQLRVLLLHLSLSAQRDTGTTLTELVAQVRALLASSPLSLAVFEDALLAAGYLDLHATRYMHPGYLKREHHFFDVKDTFPRIVGADLRAGVGDVSYSVSVAVCFPYQVAEADVVGILRTCKT
jgi:Putative  PD-(D/E)XK family member, (DUF4420)